MSYKLVMLDCIPEARASEIRAHVPECFTFEANTERGIDAMKALIKDADFAISGQVAVPGAVLSAARKLKLLHKWGVGVDNLDIEAARRLGIRVARTTGSNAVPVAEFTIGLMLSALRHIAYSHKSMSEGVWTGYSGLPGPASTLTGKTVGIVGLGAIGRKVAHLLAGFGTPILYSQRTRLKPSDERALNASYVSFSELLSNSDVVTLHCPLTAETKALFNHEAFARMKPGAVLINVARGGVVVEDDLVSALSSGQLRAAAMDVFSVEPLPKSSALRGLDNLILTPHLAASTADTFAPSLQRMIDNFLRVSKGEPLPEKDVVV